MSQSQQKFMLEKVAAKAKYMEITSVVVVVNSSQYKYPHVWSLSESIVHFAPISVL